MRLEIHILSLACRAASLARLLANLDAQITRYHLCETVAVRTCVDAGEAPAGAKRNQLLHTAAADYIASVDDDDDVTGDYLCSLLEGTAGGPDVVTFHARRTIDGGWPQRLVYSAWQPTCPDAHSDVVILPANHVCCWRREIAQLAHHAEDLPYGSDQCWWKALFLARAVTSEKHVGRVLYHYKFRRDNNGVGHGLDTTREAMRLMGPGHERTCWRHKESGRLIVIPNTQTQVDEAAYDRLGEIRLS